MIDALDGLVSELRKVGIPIALSEKIDAMAMLAHIPIDDRGAVKAALSAALVKDSGHQVTFDTVFDLYFSLASQAADGTASGEVYEDGEGEAVRGNGQGVLSTLDDAGLRELLIRALESREVALYRSIASLFVDRHAGIQPGRVVAGTYYLFRVMRAVGPVEITAALVERSPDAREASDPLLRRLTIDDLERRVDDFQREVESEIRRRLVADRGADDVARTLRRPLPEDVDFLTASAIQVSQMRTVMQPLARKLAAHIAAKRRQHRRGPLDFRRTVRKSMSTGGVPVEPIFHYPHPSKPEVVILADISGSVATFAAFTLQLVFALRGEFHKVRSFVFVDGIDEVTRILADADDILAATRRINEEGAGVWLDGRSDYGNALQTFLNEYGNEISNRAAVIVLGDARGNYHAPRAAALKEISRRSGHTFWLNPEPYSAWNSGDSVIGEYAPYCDGVFECRNIRQLRVFVEALA